MLKLAAGVAVAALIATPTLAQPRGDEAAAALCHVRPGETLLACRYAPLAPPPHWGHAERRDESWQGDERYERHSIDIAAFVRENEVAFDREAHSTFSRGDGWSARDYESRSAWAAEREDDRY